VRKKDEPRIVQQTKRNVTSDGVVQMRRRCNARRSRRSRMDREGEMGAGGEGREE